MVMRMEGMIQRRGSPNLIVWLFVFLFLLHFPSLSPSASSFSTSFFHLPSLPFHFLLILLIFNSIVRWHGLVLDVSLDFVEFLLHWFKDMLRKREGTCTKWRMHLITLDLHLSTSKEDVEWVLFSLSQRQISWLTTAPPQYYIFSFFPIIFTNRFPTISSPTLVRGSSWNRPIVKTWQCGSHHWDFQCTTNTWSLMGGTTFKPCPGWRNQISCPLESWIKGI